MKAKAVDTKQAPPIPGAQNGGDAPSTASYEDPVAEGLEAWPRESIEDPLDDWPESDRDADAWLSERRCRADEWPDDSWAT